MAGLVTESRVYPTFGTNLILRNSGKPELRRHPRFYVLYANETWMPGTQACESTSFFERLWPGMKRALNGRCHAANTTNIRLRHGPQRPRTLLDAVHGQSGFQETPAPDRGCQGYALHRQRRA